MMQRHEVSFDVDAPPHRVWRLLHPKVDPNDTTPRTFTHPGGSITILREGDDDGAGTRLTFVETYHAHNPVLRLLFERKVDRFISVDNTATYEALLGHLGTIIRLPTP